MACPSTRDAYTLSPYNAPAANLIQKLPQACNVTTRPGRTRRPPAGSIVGSMNCHDHEARGPARPRGPPTTPPLAAFSERNGTTTPDTSSDATRVLFTRPVAEFSQPKRPWIVPGVFDRGAPGPAVTDANGGRSSRFCRRGADANAPSYALIAFILFSDMLSDMAFYHGKPCRRCGKTLRYDSSSNCVNCAKGDATARYERAIGATPPRRKSRLAVEQTRLTGEMTFIGGDCARSHGGLRYTAGGTCVDCGRLRDAERYSERKSAQSTPDWINESAVLEIYREAKRLTNLTGVVHHVDHVVPLRSPLVCGLHWERNLQVLPATNNIRKGNRWWPDMP
jgi:hypothetical protein